MVVDDRARSARKTRSKYSSEDFGDSAGALQVRYTVCCCS